MVKAMARKAAVIRELRSDDLSAVVEIDEMIRGFPRLEYWKGRFSATTTMPPWMSLVAEMDDRVVGFVFGWCGSWEFGVAGEVGWIDIIGVHPAYRLMGIGRALVSEFTRSAKELRGVGKVFTLVDPQEKETASFFSRIGYRRGRLIHMETSSESDLD
jgi:ribosomal protein S18 acetylase RimI-like enzyme